MDFSTFVLSVLLLHFTVNTKIYIASQKNTQILKKMSLKGLSLAGFVDYFFFSRIENDSFFIKQVVEYKRIVKVY